MINKIIIKNRYNLNIVILINKPKDAKSLVFLMHGFGSYKEHPLIDLSEKIFSDNGFITIRFDATKSIGESEGEMKDGTLTSYCEDLEDVLIWASKQDWYREPFCLVGHSAGGYCVANYTIKNQEKVKKIILFSPLISGKLHNETDMIKSIINDWKEKGIREWESSSSPGVIKQSKYDFVEDSLNHDLLKDTEKITCPVLFISSKDDNIIPIKHQKLLVEKIKKVSFIEIEKSDHNLSEESTLIKIRNLINDFIRSSR
ncbi:MAG: alpha/beta fold hydrolase [Candidatus Paceibacterota bacterium]|jgi:alpha-beta hydrolase superfamily lysophospholipase